MIKTVKYSKEVTAIGRNGASRMCGMNFMSSTDHIHIEPVNSKGEFTNCVMGIPYKDIPKVVDMLNEFYYNLPKILR